MSRYGNAGGRLQRDIRHDLLTAADAAENAARVVALEARFGNFIAVFAAAQFHHLKTIANFYALHRINAHQRVRDIGIQTVKHRFAQPRRYAIGHHRDFRPDGVALFFRPRISSSSASILSGSGQKNGFCST